MIKRYTRPEMGRIWEEENKFRVMLEVEILACEAMAELGLIPKKSARAIRSKANFSVKRIEAIEKETNHDLIAFLWNIAEYVGKDAKYIHKGLTSSDVLDTALSCMLVEATDIIIADVRELIKEIRKKALKYKLTPMMGRSHGIHAEPITFGLKMALFYDEMNRNLKRLEEARITVAVGKISGAVGTYANIDPTIEQFVCKKLKLKPANVSTQILQRDRHAEFLNTLALVASSLEKYAVEFRHLQRTEVYEVQEYFSKTQKGSSAMPHKRNPILGERITGLARLVRSNALAGMENVALWHERDISHSSVERVIMPDSTIMLDYILTKMTSVVKNLIVHEDNMMANINKTKGVHNSQQLLLALIEKGFEREKAYNTVQPLALKALNDGTSFVDLLKKEKVILKYLSEDEIDTFFDIQYHTKHVDRIFKKVGLK